MRTRRIRLNIAMALLELSQRELATKADLDPKTVSRLMSGHVSPDNSTLTVLAQALGQRKSWLEGEGDIKDFNVPKEILDVTVDQDIVAMRMKSVVQEEPTPYAIKPIPEAKPLPINRRREIPVFKIIKREHDTGGAHLVGVPKWLDLAAGEGTDLSLCEDLIYFSPKDNFKGLHTAQVRGDSMVKTLYNGDIIVLKPFPAGGVTLRALDTEDEKTSLSTWQAQHDVREGNICVVSIRGEPPTLKRIHYDTRRGPNDWKLQIVADNAAVWPMFQADSKDHIIFYAKMIARAE